jgi:hypothetical protein
MDPQLGAVAKYSKKLKTGKVNKRANEKGLGAIFRKVPENELTPKIAIFCLLAYSC